MMETKAEYLQRMAKKQPQPCTCGHRYEQHGIERQIRRVNPETKVKERHSVACYETRCLCPQFFPEGNKR